MAAESRTALEAYFLTGEFPTQAQFAALIASCVNIVDDLPPKYVTTSYVAQDSVVITHNLGRIPTLQFVDTDTGEQFFPDSVINDMASMNFVTVSFGYSRNVTVIQIG